jgi:hypothetical protein
MGKTIHFSAKARERIEALLLEAISSGKPTPMTRAVWDRIRKEGRERARKLRGKRI